jgi:hypothetical protein
VLAAGERAADVACRGTNSISSAPDSLLAPSSRGTVIAVSSASSKVSSERCLKLKSPVASVPLWVEAPWSNACFSQSYIAWPMPRPRLARPGVQPTLATCLVGMLPGPCVSTAMSACMSRPLIVLSDPTGTPSTSSA